MSSPARVSPVLSRITPGLTGTAEIVVGPERIHPFRRLRPHRGAGDAGNDQRHRGGGAQRGRAPSCRRATRASASISTSATWRRAPVGLQRGRHRRGRAASRAAPSPFTRRSARHGFETIGGGSHERVVVSVERFDERARSANWAPRGAHSSGRRLAVPVPDQSSRSRTRIDGGDGGGEPRAWCECAVEARARSPA